ncbi:MAG: T9SS type A sorting domain-containing protein [Candidatus Edwardsbacteria bacterium]|nr:T9SS type A sorting domain-containing protein [Candidatus Edwardsbacteria bacterium]
MKESIVKRRILVAAILLAVGVSPIMAIGINGAVNKTFSPEVYLADAGPTGAKAGDYTANSFSAWPPNGGWTMDPISGDGAWLQGSLEMGSGVSPDSGCQGTLNFAEFDSWDFAVGVIGDIISPEITLPNPADDCSLSFYVWNHYYSTPGYNFDSLFVQITGDGGGNWSNLALVTGDINAWSYQALSLSSYAGQTIQVRFRAKSDYGASNMSLDEVRIGRRPVQDVGMVSILTPGKSMPEEASPAAVVVNKGAGTETFEVICTIDSAGTEVYADSKFVSSLASGAQQSVVFASYAPAIGNGNIYTATFNTLLAGDGDPGNDTLACSFNSYTEQRTVLGMDYTALWCTWCPWHQVAWKMLKEEVGDSLCVMGLHSSSTGDSFYVAHCADLKNYYALGTGLPTSIMDGMITWVGSDTSGAGLGQYNAFRSSFDKRKMIRSPFNFTLDGTYNGGTGTLNVTTNYPGATPIPVTVWVAVIEASKHTHWPTVASALPQDSIYDFVRDVLPASAGDTFSVTGGTVSRNYPFTINAGWNASELSFVVWAESRGLKENLQAGEIQLSELTGVTGKPNDSSLESRTQLLPCFPNPSGGQMVFSYDLGVSQQVDLRVYDICGRLVQTLVSERQEAGVHKINWKGYGHNGQKLSNGIYFYKLSTEDYSSVKKLMILK